MAERVQVVLEAQDLASGVLRGLVSQFGIMGQAVSDTSDALGKFSSFLDLAAQAQTDASVSAEDLETAYADAGMAMARLGETLAVMVVQGIQEAIKVTDEYNESIRDLSLVSGESAESTSRFIQVLDDFGLTADDAMTAAKALKEKGLSPSIDTLAMLADEFKKIQDPAERMAFVQENLGKGGAKWVAVLNQESGALRETANSVSQYLVKTDEQIKKAEIARLAIDDLSDSWAAFQNVIGDAKNELIFNAKASNMAYEALKKQGVAINQGTQYSQAYKDALEKAKEELLASGEASLEYTANLEEQARQLEETTKTNEDFLDLLGTMQSADDSYQENAKSLAEERIKLEGERAAALAAGWTEGSDKILEYDQKLEENRQKTVENADEFDTQNKRIMLGYIERQLAADGTLTDAELTWLLDKGVAWGVYSQTVVDETEKAMEEAKKLAEAINTIPSERTFTMSVLVQGADAVGGLGAGFGSDQWTQPSPHFAGGSFTIPTSYGSEGFPLGGKDTASGGERLTISNGQPTQSEAKIIDLLQQLVSKPTFTEYDLARVVGNAVVGASQ